MSFVSPMDASGQPRRILHFVSTFALKTDTKWLVQLARHFDSARYESAVACFYDAGPVRQQFEALGIRTFDLQSPGERDPRAVLRARRIIDQFQPDIVHTHLLRADLFAGTAARWAGIPVILSTAYAVGEYRRSRRRRADRLLDLACAALPTHVLAVSAAVKQDLIERQELDPSIISVIHTGIEPPESIDPAEAATLRRQWQVGEDQPLILTVARLSYEKGIDTLIDAAAILHRSHPGARFVVVGDGPQRADLEARIRARDLAGVVRLPGFSQNVWPALAASNVVCLPSKSEGMPNALLEAMSVGRPIVATAVGGMPEALAHRENGLLVRPENPGELAAGLRELLEQPGLAAECAAAARRTIMNRFHVRDIAARYMDLYDRLLAESRGASVRDAVIH